MGSGENLKNILRRFVRKIENDMKIHQIILLFGSRASGEMGEDSDVDLIVVSPDYEQMDFFERFSKTYEYWRSRYPADFFCYTPEEFERLKRQATIVREAVRTGTTVEV